MISQSVPVSFQYQKLVSPGNISNILINLKLYLIMMSFIFIALELKKRMLHFMRCSALFLSLSTNLPVPSVEKVTGPDDIFSCLSKYLGLPTTLDQLFEIKGVKSFISK